jgi:large subunit ribosomal protein L4
MALQIPSASSGGKSIEVSEAVFGRDYNEPLIHQLVVAYLAAGRSGTKAQKTRSEVSGGGAKPWRQKGTGRARAGTTRSPLWRTGGVTFAAKNRNYEQKLNKKMYRAAMRSIFSELLRQGRLVVAEDIAPAEPKTKLLLEKLRGIGVEKGLLITDALDGNLYLAARNLPHIDVCEAHALSPVALVNSEKVVITSEAAKKIEAVLS